MPNHIPIPAAAEEIKRVLEFTNFKTKHDEILFLTYLVGGLFAKFKRPMIVFTGEFGSGKTTHMQLAKVLLDPAFNGQYEPIDGGLLLGTDAESVDDLIQHAQWGATLYLDNLSSLRTKVSDLLCTFVTGGGTSKRTLFTNNEKFPIIANPLIGMNGISLVASRPDLLSRAIIFEVVRPKRYREDGEFWDSFNRERPTILGAMYTLAASAIARFGEYRDNPHLSRLGEYDNICASVATQLGYTYNEYIQAMSENERRRKQGAAEGSVVVQAIVAWWIKALIFAKQQNIEITGSVKFQIDESGYQPPDPITINYDRHTGEYVVVSFLEKYFKVLKFVADRELAAGDLFPKSSTHLSRQLGQLKSTLEETAGITWTEKDVQNRKRYTFMVGSKQATALLKAESGQETDD